MAIKVRELFESIFRVIMILFLSVVDSNNKNSLFRTNHHRNQWKFQKICTRGGFWRGASVKLSVMLLHRHRAIIWYAFGKAWLNPGGGGGVVITFDAFSHCHAACLFHASDDPLC